MATAYVQPVDDQKPLSDQAIVARLQQGTMFMKGFSSADRANCKRFRDSSMEAEAMTDAIEESGESMVDQAVGNLNMLQINEITKVAGVTITDPDWHVDCGQEDQSQQQGPMLDPMGMPIMDAASKAQIVRKWLRSEWRKQDWSRVTRAAYLKRCISGLGGVAKIYDPTIGNVIEHVQTWELAMDPHVVDWARPRYSARLIRMPKDEADARWPGAGFDVGQRPNEENAFVTDMSWQITENNTLPMPPGAVPIWVYWDHLEEVTVYNGSVIERAPNLYGRIPLRWIEGEINPRSQFPMGDYALATGLQVLHTWLQDLLNNQALHGGGIGWYRADLIDKAIAEALKKGKPQGFVPVEGEGAEAIGFIPAEPISPALLESLKMVQQALDSVTGVSEYQRGVLSRGVKFATEAALLSQQAGARGNQARIEYERFMDRVTMDIIADQVRFMVPRSPAEFLLHDALSSVQDVNVLESSTAYKDPAYEQQTNIQLLQAAMPFIQGGLMNPRPLLEDLLRAFGKQDIDKYFAAPGPMGQPGQPQMLAAPGEPTAAPGAPPAAAPPPAPGEVHLHLPGAVQHILKEVGAE